MNPEISIVIPFFDYRVDVSHFRSWTQKQSCLDNRFEVIVVSDGKDPAIEHEIQSVLRPHDSFLRDDSPNASPIDRIQKGIGIAKGRLLLLTEDHTIAHRTCVEKVLEFIENGVHAVGFLRSDYTARNVIGHMEERLFQQFVPVNDSLPTWKRVQLRGFAILRELFLDYGGFPAEYNSFSANALGIVMEQMDVEIGLIRDAKVTHVNHYELRGMEEDAIYYFQGEVAYRLANSAEHCESFIGSSIELLEREAIERYFTRNNDRRCQTMIQWRLFRAKSAFQLALLRWKLCFQHEETQFAYFQKMWSQLAHYARLRALLFDCHRRCCTPQSVRT